MTEGGADAPNRLTRDDDHHEEDEASPEIETGHHGDGNLGQVSSTEDEDLRDEDLREEHLRDADEASSMEVGLGGEENLAQVSVTVDDEHLESMDQVVEALKESGMHVDAVLESLGLVTGSTPDADALREVEGVSGVDAQLEHQIAPPEDEVQ